MHWDIGIAFMNVTCPASLTSFSLRDEKSFSFMGVSGINIWIAAEPRSQKATQAIGLTNCSETYSAMLNIWHGLLSSAGKRSLFGSATSETSRICLRS
jgi:hypothetical protein